MSFIFGGQTGLTYEQIQRKRRIAETLTRQNSYMPRNAGEGMVAIGRALVARKSEKDADAAETKARGEFDAKWQTALALMGGSSSPYSVSTRSAATTTPRKPGTTDTADPRRGMLPTGANTQNSGNATGYDKETISAYIRKAAVERGIDPEIALRVAASEGLNADPAEAWQSNFVKNGRRERSYGPYQLYIDGGLGNQFMDSTGLDPRNPDTWRQQVDYSLDHASKNGWGAWYGAKNVGINNMDGIGGKAPGGGMTNAIQMASLASSPYASPEQKAVAQMLIQQSMQANDPMRQLQMERQQLEIDRLRNPTPEMTDDMREYEFARSQGYEGTFNDFMQEMRKAGASSVSVHNSPGEPPVPAYNKLPSGFVYKRDANGQIIIGEDGVPVAAPITGGPEDTSPQEEVAQANRERSGDVVIEDIDRVLGMANDGGLPTSGGVGALLSNIPGTDSHNTSKLLETIRANVGFDRLQQMRDASPTGGALGAINQTEMNLLTSALGSLEQSQSKEQFERNLVRLRDIYTDIVHGGASGSPEGGQTFESFSADPGAQRAAKKYGVTLQEMWDMKQGLR